MNRRLSWWLYKKATKAVTEVLGEEELESLKKDLVNPVKIAVRDAMEDILEDDDEDSQMD